MVPGVPVTQQESSVTASSSSVALQMMDCDEIPLPAAPTTTEEMILDGFGTVRVPYNSSWLDDQGEQLMWGEKTSGGMQFGAYRYVPDFNQAGLRHWKNTICEPSRDFDYSIAIGTREELLAQEQERVPPPASPITQERIGEVDTIVVLAPDAACPTPHIIVLNDGGPSYDFSLSCEAVRFYKNPLQELRHIVETIKTTK